MIRTSIVLRTTKTDGKIRLRFRLVDGRKADLYHKSEIEAQLSEISKFTPDGVVKNGIRTVNQELDDAIKKEMMVMTSAYKLMREKQLAVTGDIFESTIRAMMNPEQDDLSQEDETLLEVRLEKFIHDGLRDEVFGKSRAKLYYVLLGIVRRFLVIKGYLGLQVKNVTGDWILEFRQFLFEENIYVKEWRQLYVNMRPQNIPTKKRRSNTVAARMIMLNTFFNELEERGEIIKNPFRRLDRRRRRKIMHTHFYEPICLRAGEWKILTKTDVPQPLKETQKAFLLQCMLGLRISDAQALTMDNVSVSDDGTPYIHYLPIKTMNQQDQEEVKIPILRLALDIIKETHFKFAITRYPTGKSGYNAKIRELLRYCGINRKCSVFNEETNQYEPKRLWSQASSMLARKTYVDMLVKVQINPYLGGVHHYGSKAVGRYFTLSIEERFQLLCAAFYQKPYKTDKYLNIIE